jgi:hypothetical protein
MQSIRLHVAPHVRLCLRGLTVFALLAACEADRYPVGDGLPAEASMRETGDPKVPGPATVPQLAPPSGAPAGAHPVCPLPGAAIPSRPLAISALLLGERLSRFIWDTPADVAFLQKVNRLAPTTSTEVADLAREMMDDPRADARVKRFYRGWLELKDRPAAAPGLDDATWTSMQRETDELVVYLTRYGGNLADLLQVPFSFLDARLGSHYGVTVSGDEFRRVDLDPEERGGVLTHASWLGSHPTASSRGLWLNGALYCRRIPPPPAGDIHTMRITDMALTSRERQEQLTAQMPVCSGCHALLDPPGFLYENFDFIGRYRVRENGRAVNARADVMLPGFDGRLEKASGLAKNAAGSCEAQACFAQHWLTAATGIESPAQGAIDEVAAAFRAARLSLRDLIVAVAQSPLFLQP